MKTLKWRTLFITALALGAAQASMASGCRWPCDPPFGRNGWQPAATKALPQTAAVQAPAGGAIYEPPSGRNGWQPTVTATSLPVSAAAKTRLRQPSNR